MRHFSQGRFTQQMNLLRQQFVQSSELPFGDLLSSAAITQVLAAAKLVVADRIYTPLTTLLVFLWQVTSQDHSCRQAVAKLIAHRVGRGEPACSPETGGYCTARKRLPESVFADLARHTGRELDARSPSDWRWKKRVVKVFDGSTVSMPDTPANQGEYPQPASQQPGIGFPLARIAVVFSLACGAVLDLALCQWTGKGHSELGLLRLLLSVFQPGDVMLADRYLCSWFELALLRRGEVDFVARLHHRRRADFRRGRRLGPDDHVVHWPKPPRPEWMDEATYDALPAELEVREVRTCVPLPGFRTRAVIVATSLVDHETYSAADLAELYRQRWHAELDLRCLKATLQMDQLRCKTPELVRKEIWTHLLAYNLIRTVMAQAAHRHQLPPRTISFKGALQTLTAFQPLLESTRPTDLACLHAQLLQAIATHRVADRPNRCEPRARKRRPKPYPLLTQPRAQARRALLRNDLR